VEAILQDRLVEKPTQTKAVAVVVLWEPQGLILAVLMAELVATMML